MAQPVRAPRTRSTRTGHPVHHSVQERTMSVPTASTRPGRRGGWFADRPLGVKIGALVGLLAVVVIATNLLAVTRIGEMRDGQERIYTENLEPLNALSAVQRATAAHRARVLEYAV